MLKLNCPCCIKTFRELNNYFMLYCIGLVVGHPTCAQVFGTKVKSIVNKSLTERTMLTTTSDSNRIQVSFNYPELRTICGSLPICRSSLSLPVTTVVHAAWRLSILLVRIASNDDAAAGAAATASLDFRRIRSYFLNKQP